VSLADGYRMVAFGSIGGASTVSGVPSSKQKFREVSVYVRLQVGQRFIFVYRRPKQSERLSERWRALKL
jgi:hypothetical protein